MSSSTSNPTSSPSNFEEGTNASIALWKAWLPILVLVGLLAINVMLYQDDATAGANQIALVIAAAVAALVGLSLKVRLGSMIEGIKRSIQNALGAILILLLIGALIGTWVISGIVPALIYYGLQVLDAKIFLGASVIVCAIVSVATGSSWSTVGTVGVALMGIGQALGVSPAMTAGAIISGAYFGDKISPLSDTTNLAAAMAGTDLITHIRYLMYTTIPSILITLIIFFALGYSSGDSSSVTQTEALQVALDEQFNINPWLFVVPVIVLGMVTFKIDPLAALFVGAVLGGISAIIFQPRVVTDLSGYEPKSVVTRAEDETSDAPNLYQSKGWEYSIHSYMTIVNAMATKVQVVSIEQRGEWESKLEELEQKLGGKIDAWSETVIPDGERGDQLELNHISHEIAVLRGKLAAAELMQGRGMEGMLSTIWLIVCAMCFGGVMEACGLLQRITAALLSFANSVGSLVATTAGSCIFLNLTASDQYLAIVVPGQMFRDVYEERGLAPQNLSRTLEGSGTVTSVLIPWNTCGAAQSSVLNLSTWAFAPFCFFNWISPLMILFFAFTGIGIAKRKNS